MEQWWNDTDRGKLKQMERNCTIATFSTTYLTQAAPGPNAEAYSKRLVINCLSHGMACHSFKHALLCCTVKVAMSYSHIAEGDDCGTIVEQRAASEGWVCGGRGGGMNLLQYHICHKLNVKSPGTEPGALW
jgi:hypothetical protein